MQNVKCTAVVIFSRASWLWNLNFSVRGEAAGSLLREDHWVRDNSPSCAKACRASPSCSALPSLQSWWLAPSSSLTLLLNHEAVSHWSKRVCVRLKTDWMIVAVYSHASSWPLPCEALSRVLEAITVTSQVTDIKFSFIFERVLKGV